MDSSESTSHLELPPPYSEHIPALGSLDEPCGGREPLDRGAIIDSLPVESLQTILHFVCKLPSADPGIVEVRQAQATVRSFILVSRLWRMIALGEKEPWCLLLDFHRCSAPASARLLELSNPLPFKVGHRSTPLLVNLSISEKETCKSIAVINLLCEHQERIQEIHVQWECYGSGALEDRYLAFCRLPMPRLEALSWRGPGPFDISAVQIASHTPHIYGASSTTSSPVQRHRILLPPRPMFPNFFDRSCHYQPRKLAEAPRTADLSTTPRAAKIYSQSTPSTPQRRFGEQCTCSILVELPHLRLVTVNGGISSQELSKHLALLTSINSSPMCGLDISAVTPAQIDDISLMVQQRIATLFQMSNPLEIGLYLTVDEWSHISLGNITNPEHALDWTHLGGDAVCSALSSLPMPVVTFKLAGTQGSQDESCSTYHACVIE
ncbi:hypothetical protein DFP72DRAFT_408401 [Ephemerocybe angulata]|uniref:F-box domain-containing protein n=1 Tax=Ephemerocybe angulata TaxID=980116 RepID=A0A8H6M638_9AGAR|nr:hypothetical protein DFP72DRAFT_408401 [Tulosesus angulatus]